MALGVVGEGSAGAGYSSISAVTSVAADADSTIVFCVAWQDTPTLRTLNSISDSVGTFVTDLQQQTNSGNPTLIMNVSSLYHASGLPSGSTITVSMSGTTGGPARWTAIALPGDVAAQEGTNNSVGTNQTDLDAGSISASAAGVTRLGVYSQMGGTTPSGTTSEIELSDQYISSPSPTVWLWAGKQIAVGADSDNVPVTVSSTGTIWVGIIVAYPTALEGPPPQELRPDADTTTTGWTTTPLFSKINDDSDATVITGALS